VEGFGRKQLTLLKEYLRIYMRLKGEGKIICSLYSMGWREEKVEGSRRK
jgi:hypothetical protein